MLVAVTELQELWAPDRKTLPTPKHCMSQFSQLPAKVISAVSLSILVLFENAKYFALGIFQRMPNVILLTPEVASSQQRPRPPGQLIPIGCDTWSPITSGHPLTRGERRSVFLLV